MMKNNYIYQVLCLAIILFSGCDIINPPEDIPAYIYIDNFQVNTKSEEGTNSSKITDAFVFVEGSFLGVYMLPATFPALETGQTRIDVFPGIKDNGINATPEIYPFYTVYQKDIDLEAGRTDSLKPVVEYLNDLEFSIIERFENTLQTFRDDIDGDEGTKVEITETDVFEGQKSGKIVLSKEHPIIEVGSARFDELPIGSQGVYLELNYKTEVPFEIGLFYYDELNTITVDFQHGLNANTTWNKVYLNMTPEFTSLMNIRDFKEFQIGLRSIMARDDSGEYLDGTREILLDNVKLIHF